jgi:glycosyltransferase involved in cell wall biosynthesis
MRISFLIYRENAGAYVADWDWMEHHPLGGTEASVLHMAKAFRAMGHDVLVTHRPMDLARGSDVFISTRGWEIFAKRIRPGRLNYLWCTDDIDQPFVRGLTDPAVAAATYGTVDGVMVLSDYQRRRWEQSLHLPADKVFQTTNGIPAEKFSAGTEDRPRWLYYGSTPFRGLDVLLAHWPAIRSAVPDAELHVFSSMGIYGVDDPPAFRELYARAREAAGAHYHGAQGQVAIREVASQCRVLAYPCTFPETSCIAAMEAMAAGCAVVTTALGALPETAAGNILIAPSAGWQVAWRDAVIETLRDDAQWRRMAQANRARTEARSWLSIAATWLERFTSDAARRQVALGVWPQRS